MYASAVCRIGCAVQKTISIARLQIPIETVTEDSASHSQDKMSHKRGGKWAHLCLLKGKVPASLPFPGTLVVTVEIPPGFPLSPPAAAALLFPLLLSSFPSQTTKGRKSFFRKKGQCSHMFLLMLLQINQATDCHCWHYRYYYLSSLMFVLYIG